MDPKILHKVKPFDGQRSSWKTFSFQYRAYLIAQDRRYRDLLEKCEDGAQEVDNVTLETPEEELSTQLYYALVLAMPEDSVGELIVRNSPVGEGAECWRKLQKEYSPSEAGNVLAMWTKLTDTKFDAKEDMMVSISKLDEDMARYQKIAGEAVSDLIKRGILTKALKDHEELQKHVFRNSSRLNTYELLRAEVVSALTAERAVQDDPMEIGALKGGKRQWKGRGKGKDGKGSKGKDKTSNPDAEMECHYCHKKGHRSANCRKKIADEKKTADKDKKQLRKDTRREKKKIGAAAVQELERLRQAGVGTGTSSAAPTQQMLGSQSSLDSAMTTQVMRPAGTVGALRAKMILALRADVIRGEDTSLTGCTACQASTDTTDATLAGSTFKDADGTTFTGTWTSVPSAPSTAWIAGRNRGTRMASSTSSPNGSNSRKTRFKLYIPERRRFLIWALVPGSR